MKQLLFKQDARKKLLDGCQIMYDAVGTTYSPRGRLVSIQRQWSWPKVLADGVSVAREVSTEDVFARQGVDLIREAAENQVRECGDGTTLVTILTYHLVREGMEYVEQGVNPMVIRKELEASLPRLLQEIDGMARPVSTNDDIKRVATISAQSEEIGSLVAQAFDQVGRDGQVTVDESKTDKTYIEVSEGMTFNKGFTSHYFMTNPSRREAVVQNPLVAVIGKKITTQSEIVPLLEVMVKKSKDLLFIGEIAGVALQIIIQNKMQGNFNALVVEPSGFGDNRKSNLEDIATITNAKVLNDELGLPAEEFYAQYQQNGKYWLGRAKTALSTSTSTIIIPADDEATKKRVTTRAELLREHLSSEESLFEKEKLEERLARLTTGVATIRVGAKTEVASKEKVERVKDAIGAASSSMVSGIVPGGGVSLWRLADFVDTKTAADKMLHKALIAPLEKLLDNAGVEKNEQQGIFDSLETADAHIGYELISGAITDMVEAGVVDPAEVIKKALENAVSVAGTILCTDCLIVDIPEKETHE